MMLSNLNHFANHKKKFKFFCHISDLIGFVLKNRTETETEPEPISPNRFGFGSTNNVLLVSVLIGSGRFGSVLEPCSSLV